MASTLNKRTTDTSQIRDYTYNTYICKYNITLYIKKKGVPSCLPILMNIIQIIILINDRANNYFNL